MTITWLDTLDSTNSEALRRLPELPSGTVLSAREQTAGRGQRGNSWFSEPGQNLTFSIVLKDLPLKAAEGMQLNYLASVAVADYLQACGVSAAIKWPNDIYVGDRKICGMLIENGLATDGGIASSVIGIGLNVNQLQFNSLVNATSLAACTGRQYNLPRELEAFLAVFEGLLPRLGSPVLQEAYTYRLYRKGIPARYHNLLTDSFFTGVILGVEPDGRLRVRDAGTGEELLFRFKELGYIL